MNPLRRMCLPCSPENSFSDGSPIQCGIKISLPKIFRKSWICQNLVNSGSARSITIDFIHQTWVHVYHVYFIIDGLYTQFLIMCTSCMMMMWCTHPRVQELCVNNNVEYALPDYQHFQNLPKIKELWNIYRHIAKLLTFCVCLTWFSWKSK